MYNINKILTHNNVLTIKEHALSKPNEEVCGFIIANNNSFLIYKGTNINNNKSKFFTISPKDYLCANHLGSIIGVYHSHTINGSTDFSDLDKQNAKKHKLLYILYTIKNNKLLIYDYNADNKFDTYLNKEFVFGKQDCYSLIQEYYRKELNIQLPDIDRNIYWYQTNKYKIKDEYTNFFSTIFVEKQDLKQNDILIFKYDKDIEPHHLGIYIGNNSFLHHPRNKYSTIELYSNIYIKRTEKILRLK
jgi:proteasome lid subunit RPN8/RPN11